MIFEHGSYRSFLRSALNQRIEKNPSYSLRSFAQQLKIPVSLVSEIIRGKRNLTLENAQRVVEHLTLDETERQYFFTLVQFENAKSPQIREMLQTQLSDLRPEGRKIHDLSLDAFQSLTQWYHHAIIQSFTLANFEVTATSLAKRLKIHPAQAQEALDRLERLEVITRDKDGKYLRLENNTLIRSHGANVGIRKFHKGMFEKAIESIETQTNDEKFIGTETFAFNPEGLKQASKIIEDCFKKLIRLAATQEERTEIYHAGIAFFRLTEPNSKKKGAKK